MRILGIIDRERLKEDCDQLTDWLIDALINTKWDGNIWDSDRLKKWQKSLVL